MIPIRLLVFDAGHTLGRFTGPSSSGVLDQLSPLPKHVVAEESRRLLHRKPELTADDVLDLCGSLLIDPARWPVEWPVGEFTAYPYTPAVLDELATELGVPVVVLSNIPFTVGRGRMAALQKQLPQISRIYTSYDMRMRKPDPRLWQTITTDHGVRTDETVHIGDQFSNDVLGAIRAGCRAIYVDTRDMPAPPEDEWPAGTDRIGLGRDLRDVPALLRQWSPGRN